MKHIILYFLTLFALPAIYATAIWNNTSIFDVTDENIEITGDCYLQESVTEINAINCDVTVEIKKDAIIHAQEEAQEIDIYAEWPYSVTIKVDHDLEFRGIDGQPTENLMIYVYGDGAIRWEIDEDSTLKFNSTSNSGGVKLWHTYYNQTIPIHIFKVSKQHQITFGKRCSIGFSVEDGCLTALTDVFIEADDVEGSDNNDDPYIVMDNTSQFALKLVAVG
ncbi:MAG TPA: hypothetical protein VL201_00205 [Patescibacteria group bacterium]|jgi:hypothetical protein|nr:hypothetical protein [Patescibacteria group bacterium]